MADKSPVLSVIVRRFRPSDRDAADEVLSRFEEALHSWPGFLGVRHNQASPGGDGAMATVISFRTLGDLIAWEQSDTRKNIVEELSQYIEGEVVKNQLWDLNALLGGPRPP
jgi:antibiotic biosynthesis monooxygenase (ABM) superfamily enzyme